MKNKFLLLCFTCILCLVGASAFAQLSANPPIQQSISQAPPLPTSEGNFLQTVQAYFTSFNTNLDSTFATERAEFAAGVDSIQGGKVPLANSLRVSYDLPGTNWWHGLSLESVTRDGGVAGGFISSQVGLGINFVVHDAKFTVYCDGGYNIVDSNNREYAEIGIRVSKALTTHTFGGAGVGAILPGNSQTLQLFGGATF